MNYGSREFTQQYLRQQIENASPAQQLVLLYDGVIKFLMQAKDAIGRGDIQSRHNANRRAMEIVGYLLEILDVEKGGEVGQRLQRIYTFILKRLMDVDFKNDPTVCDEVIEHLRLLRASWNQLAEKSGPTAGGAKVVAGPSAEGPVGKRNAVA